MAPSAPPLFQAGIDSVRDRACLVDMLKDGGKKTKKFNRLVYSMVNDLQKGFKRRKQAQSGDDPLGSLTPAEQKQYQAMSWEFLDQEETFKGLVPPSLKKQVEPQVARGVDT